MTVEQHEHLHDTRFRYDGKLVLPFYRISRCQSSFYYRSIFLWNELPSAVRDMNVVSQLKRELKRLHLDKM